MCTWSRPLLCWTTYGGKQVKVIVQTCHIVSTLSSTRVLQTCIPDHRYTIISGVTHRPEVSTMIVPRRYLHAFSDYCSCSKLNIYTRLFGVTVVSNVHNTTHTDGEVSVSRYLSIKIRFPLPRAPTPNRDPQPGV